MILELETRSGSSGGLIGKNHKIDLFWPFNNETHKFKEYSIIMLSKTRKLFSRSRFKKAEVKSRFIFHVSRFKNANRKTRKLISRFYNFLIKYYIDKL